MDFEKYLTQRLVLLKPLEDWTNPGNRLWFIFPKRGVGRYVCGQATQTLSPGDVLMVNATAQGNLKAMDNGGFTFQCFCACLEHLIPLFAPREICLLQTVTYDLGRGRLYLADTTLARECHTLLDESPPQLSLEHRSHLLRIVAHIFSEEFKNALTRPVNGFVRPEEHVMKVLDGLSSNDILDLPVDDLAAKFGCSRRHLNRVFHEHFGTSVAALKMEMRLLKAASLLQNPHAKVINVAEDCGFNHLGLFNMCFKRRFGASPGLWRKKNLPKVEAEREKPVERDPACRMRKNGLCPWASSPMHCAPAVSVGISTSEYKSAARSPSSRSLVDIEVEGEPFGPPRKTAARAREALVFLH